MRAGLTAKLFLASLSITLMGQFAFAQNASELPDSNLSSDLLSTIGVPSPKLTPIQPKAVASGLPVKVLYDGPEISGHLALSITISKKSSATVETEPGIVSQSTLHLTNFTSETDAIVNLPKALDGLEIQAALRDENQNLLLETAFPIPVSSNALRFLNLTPPVISDPNENKIPDFTGIETIAGKIILPRRARLLPGSTFHVQLLENALAGGLSIKMVAQSAGVAIVEDQTINFILERGTWGRLDDPDLAFKAWISDPFGRKIYVMSKPVGYNGPEIEYALRLDSLKQGKDTKRGKNLDPSLLAQTLVQGEAQFDPVIGIPGQARLKIQLRQDRGDFNQNPILAEQTLILRGLETRIPFALTTDSTHFDPYAPAPFLSVALTDSFGRVYYQSGDVRAREDQNSVRLYPR